MRGPLPTPGQYLAVLAHTLGWVHDFRPEWESAALGGFGGMNSAAAIVQEVAVGARGHAKPQAIGGAVDVLALEARGGHAEVLGGTFQVSLGKVHEALLAAAFGTPRLALKADSLRHATVSLSSVTYYSICDIFPGSSRGGEYVPGPRYRAST